MSSSFFAAARGGNVAIEGVVAVEISGTQISSLNGGASAGGNIRIEGGALTMHGGTVASVNQLSPSRGGDVTVDVGSLRMSAGASLSTTTSGTAFNPTDKTSGDLTVDVTGAALITDPHTTLKTSSASSSSAGNIALDFGSLTLTREASIQAGSFEGNQGGTLTLGANTIVIADGAGISSPAFSQDIGPITIRQTLY